MRLDGASAIVTGGASGLGAATARRLVDDGAMVTIFDRDERRAQAVAGQCGCGHMKVDVTDPDDVAEAIASLPTVSPLRAVVNCAGGGPPPRPMLGPDGDVHDLESWQHTLDLNVTGTFNVTRYAAAKMAASTPDDAGLRGVVVTVSSIAAFRPGPDIVAYSTAKAAILGFTLGAASAYRTAGIRVVGIAPGSCRTPAMEAFMTRRPDDVDLSSVLPSRLGEPDEFAELVSHIAANDYLNSQIIRLDGGALDGF